MPILCKPLIIEIPEDYLPYNSEFCLFPVWFNLLSWFDLLTVFSTSRIWLILTWSAILFFWTIILDLEAVHWNSLFCVWVPVRVITLVPLGISVVWACAVLFYLISHINTQFLCGVFPSISDITWWYHSPTEADLPDCAYSAALHLHKLKTALQCQWGLSSSIFFFTAKSRRKGDGSNIVLEKCVQQQTYSN